MSRLLDMLRRSKGDIADAVAPLIAGEVHRNPQSPAAARAEAASSSCSGSLGVETAQPAPAEAASLSQIRTINLRVAAPSPLLPFESSYARASEQYRVLRTRISQHPGQPSLIVFTSPAGGDGKSVTAINTAAALALKSEGRVLLLDADLRKSAIHRQLGLPESPGLADVLAGASTLDEAIVRAREFPKLYIMSAGAPLANPAELLDSQRWHSLCGELRGLFRYVVIDSPPVGGLADYDLIQAISDGIVLVLRPDSTNRELCNSALQLLPKNKFLGVVLNCIPEWSLGRAPDSAYYGYLRDKRAAAAQPATAPQN